MRAVFSFLFDRLTDPLGLPIAPLWEYLILFAIGGIAYLVAYTFVGDLYANDEIHLGCTGSILHWFVRFIVFLAIWAITYAIIWLVKLIFAHWVAILCILGGILLLAAIACAVWVVMQVRRAMSASEIDEER